MYCSTWKACLTINFGWKNRQRSTTGHNTLSISSRKPYYRMRFIMENIHRQANGSLLHAGRILSRHERPQQGHAGDPPEKSRSGYGSNRSKSRSWSTTRNAMGWTYLSYIRNGVRFKCDWKRKLFSTNYTILSEMVVTDGKESGINTIPYKMAFRSSQSLSDKVSNFADEGFWGSYNIIEPTESLEHAVNKLKKQHR